MVPAVTATADQTGSVLARCVGDIDEFAARHWGRHAFLRPAAGSFCDLLTLDDIELLLRLGARRPTFRLVKDGTTVPPAECTRTLRLGGRLVDDVADPARVPALMADGATLVLHSLQHTWAPLAGFCRDLQDETGHPVQANAYLTPAGSAGLRRHADTHEVIVVQLEGAKSWDVDGLGPVDLEAGDVLYIPAGVRHDASTTDRYSLHLTVGILAVTYRHVVQRMVDAMDGLAAPLPLGFHREAAGQLHDELDAVLRRSATCLGAARRQEHGGGRATACRAPVSAVRPEPAVRPRPGGHPRRCPAAAERRAHARASTAEDGAALLRFGGRRLRIPAKARRAVDVVASRPEFTVSDLVGLDQDGRAGAHPPPAAGRNRRDRRIASTGTFRGCGGFPGGVPRVVGQRSGGGGHRVPRRSSRSSSARPGRGRTGSEARSMLERRADGDGVMVTFRIPTKCGADSVAVLGEFNGWAPDAHAMTRDGDDFVATIHLRPGRAYRFRYLLDGVRWENDWAADSYTVNDFGGHDSVLDLAAFSPVAPIDGNAPPAA